MIKRQDYLSERFGDEMTDSEKYGGTKTCPNCSRELDSSVYICPNCGERVEAVQGEKEEKSAIIASLATLLFPGLGQIYNGEKIKGVLIFAFGVLLVIPLAYLFWQQTFSVIMFYLITFLLVFWVFNIYDAGSTAKDISRGM